MAESPLGPSGKSRSLAPGDRLGRYEIVSLLGAGGMGEVYRARDPQLQRDVALKVMRGVSADAERIARFGREARAAGGLNHPNIVAVYDVGSDGGVPYVVSELLEGETLRARLDRGPLPFRKAVDYGIQIAQALDAAHAKNIWHRDVKPANAFITGDGRLKLLDFGIAKLSERNVGAEDSTEEVSHSSEILGTAGYMSPEQVLGQPVDHRSDIFSLGAVLYEMFTGTRAFKRASTVDTMSAVLHEDPVDPLTLNARLPMTAVAVVRRCLEKNREERFQSARDLVFDLQQLRESTGTARPLSRAPRPRSRGLLLAIAAAAVLFAGMVLGRWLTGPARPPTFEQLTFGRARIGSARFTSDGRAVVYSEARDGRPVELRRADLSDNVARSLDYRPGSDILAASDGGLAISLDRQFIRGDRFRGTLAFATGRETPRPSRENVEEADYDSTGTGLAVVFAIDNGSGGSRLEYPVGTLLHETDGSIRFPRVSRDGRRIAFLDDPSGRGASGYISVIDLRDRQVVRLSGEWASVRGLAWSPSGQEIWFAAGKRRSNRALHAIDLGKNERLVMDAPGSVTLWDVSRDGLALVTRDDERRFMVGKPPGGTEVIDRSWLDDTGVAALSEDGETVLFADRFGVFLRSTTNNTPPIQLAKEDRFADDLSADKKWAVVTHLGGNQLFLLPTGPGDPRPLPARGIVSYQGALLHPDGKHVVFTGKTEVGGLKVYIQDLDGGEPRALTPENIRAVSVSPRGGWVAATGDQGISLWPVDSAGPSRVVPLSLPDDRPVAWSPDERTLWVFRRDQVPAPVFRHNIATGEREQWTTLKPADLTGVHSINEFHVTSDGRSYFYSYRRVLSELYLISGLR